MNKNLVFVAAGDSSLHREWIGNSEFDLFVNYYGEKGSRYETDGKYYSKFKGTKFNILQQALQEFHQFKEYDRIWVPDDDLYLLGDGVARLFEVFEEFNLMLAQPGIIGYLSIPISAALPFSRLRFTNWVEIMCPLFSRSCLEMVNSTFNENKSHWGIEFLWNKILGFPKDKIAIIDETPAVHTRACFYGDNYYRNNLSCQIAMTEANQVIDKHNLVWEHLVYNTVPVKTVEFNDLPSREKFYPYIPRLRDIVDNLIKL